MDGALRETIRVVDGRLPLLRFHLERLTEGGIAGERLSALAGDLAAAAEGDPAACKLQVTVGREGGVRVHVSHEPSTLSVPGGPEIVPIVVKALPALPALAAKPADRAYWDGPHRLAALRGAQQAVLVTAEGGVVDGSTATVWAVFGRTLVTPPAPPAVAGVARRVILREVAPALGLAAEVRPLQIEDLDRADEVLLSNAVGGVVPAHGRGGEVTREVCEAFDRLLGLL